MTTQLEFLREGVTEADQVQLRARLAICGWQTRRQLVQALGWTERKIRDVAETMFTDVVRGQRGYCLTEKLTREELGDGLQAADAAISQAKRMMKYGFGLKKRLHERVA